MNSRLVTPDQYDGVPVVYSGGPRVNLRGDLQNGMDPDGHREVQEALSARLRQ